LRLARLFGTSAEMWMNLQTKYDLELAEELAEVITREVDPYIAETAEARFTAVRRAPADRKSASRARRESSPRDPLSHR
jgi:hypothetical protein